MVLSPFTAGISASQFLRSVISPQPDSVQLAIISDGAIGLAGGYLLTGKTDSLQIYLTHEDAGKKNNSANTPFVVELVERGKQTGNQIPLQVDLVTKDRLESLKTCKAIMIAEPATAYGEIISRLKDYFVNGQTVLLVNAPLGAGLQFNHELQKARLDHQLNVLELGTLFDCARVDSNVLKVVGARRKVSFCGNTRNETRRALSVTSSLSKALVPASTVLERGFAELERIIRPVLLLFALLGGTTDEFSDLSHVVNPSLTLIVRGLEAEIQAICKAYRLTARSFLDSLTELSAVHWDDADCLEQALITVGPTLLSQIRWEMANPGDICKNRAIAVLTKDVTETLTLIEDLAHTARVHTPVLDSIINLANVITRSDLRKTGRNLSNLGLFGFDTTEIIELINS